MIEFQADEVTTGKRISDKSFWVKFGTGEYFKDQIAQCLVLDEEQGIHVVVMSDSEYKRVKEGR